MSARSPRNHSERVCLIPPPHFVPKAQRADDFAVLVPISPQQINRRIRRHQLPLPNFVGFAQIVERTLLLIELFNAVSLKHNNDELFSSNKVVARLPIVESSNSVSHHQSPSGTLLRT